MRKAQIAWKQVWFRGLYAHSADASSSHILFIHFWGFGFRGFGSALVWAYCTLGRSCFWGFGLFCSLIIFGDSGGPHLSFVPFMFCKNVIYTVVLCIWLGCWGFSLSEGSIVLYRHWYPATACKGLQWPRCIWSSFDGWQWTDEMSALSHTQQLGSNI